MRTILFSQFLRLSALRCTVKHSITLCPEGNSGYLLKLHNLSARCHSSETKERSYWQFLKRKVLKPPSPPYSHICQVGDPVLRLKASPVDPTEITSSRIQNVIKHLIKVMRKMDCIGLSAPQIGVSLQIIALEYPVHLVDEEPESLRKTKGLASFPLKIFVNPSIRIVDSKTITFREACESISGFSACVPRYHAVEISGLNERGEPVSWQTDGWPARIIQHEMDHLNGVLFIDRMDSNTFENIKWMELNE